MRDVATDIFASLLDALEVAHADDPVEAAVRRSGFAELSGEPPARSPGVNSHPEHYRQRADRPSGRFGGPRG